MKPRIIHYGPNEGPYFRWWRIEYLAELIARELTMHLPDVTEYHVYYDPIDDFHRCDFVRNGRHVRIRFYINIAYAVDGVPGWQGCCRTNRFAFVRGLAAATAVVPTEEHAHELVKFN